MTEKRPSKTLSVATAFSPVRFSQLSAPRQILVRVCQSVDFGEIRGVRVRDSDPIIEPDTMVVIDAKLDKIEEARPELELADFELRVEVCRLMKRLDQLKNGTIERLEVSGGIPRRVLLESPWTVAVGNSVRASE